MALGLWSQIMNGLEKELFRLLKLHLHCVVNMYILICCIYSRCKIAQTDSKRTDDT